MNGFSATRLRERQDNNKPFKFIKTSNNTTCGNLPSIMWQDLITADIVCNLNLFQTFELLSLSEIP